MQRISRREWLRLAGLGALAGVAAACQSGPASKPTVAPTAAAQPASAGSPVENRAAPPPLALALASSELVVGPNRFAMGVLVDGRPVAGAAVTYEFFQVDGSQATKRAEAEAVYRSLEGGRGVYVARTTFDQAGSWGVRATVKGTDAPPLSARNGFEVLEKGYAPTPGQPAIPSRNPTIHDVSSPEQICSAQPPCDMHDLSIEAALQQRRPLMITFSTPGYCTSQLCGPVLGEVEKIKQQLADRVGFVHIEIYKDPRNLVVADTVTEWGLRSEPWVFIVNDRGLIADRLESITTADELSDSLATVL